MQELVSKVAIIGIVLVALALILNVFVRSQSLYQEAQFHMSQVVDASNRRTLSVVHCFTNLTTNNSNVHVYNYGEANYSTHVVIYYGDQVVFESDLSFPPKNITVIEISPPEGNTFPSDYSFVIFWMDAGEVEVVRCVGPES